MNRNIDELRTLMSISANASESKIMEAFDSIADYLKNYCVIKAKDGEYRILDFEFYFFNQKIAEFAIILELNGYSGCLGIG